MAPSFISSSVAMLRRGNKPELAFGDRQIVGMALSIGPDAPHCAGVLVLNSTVLIHRL